MLKNIKSLFIIKTIFYYMTEKDKLELIKYDKKLQNKIGINLTTYKNFSGRYIVYETKEDVKEYDINNDELVFKGKYSNKKRNGKGKEYKNNRVTFEGEYLKGKRIGKGKEFNEFGDVIFEGEYFYNNIKKGRKYYDYDERTKIERFYSFFEKQQKLEFEGEFKFDKKWDGKGYDLKVIYYMN